MAAAAIAAAMSRALANFVPKIISIFRRFRISIPVNPNSANANPSTAGQPAGEQAGDRAIHGGGRRPESAMGRILSNHKPPAAATLPAGEGLRHFCTFSATASNIAPAGEGRKIALAGAASLKMAGFCGDGRGLPGLKRDALGGGAIARRRSGH
jgi:hypothetical protein